MKKREIFGLWLCLLGIALLAFSVPANWILGYYGGAIVFLVGSYLLLNSLWNRRKDN